MTTDPLQPRSSKRFLECVFVFGFVGLNLASPWVFGELYPFTISPMFCDEPSQCCQFEAFREDGISIPLEEIQLQRNYDGNPVGLGVGLKPNRTLDQFGEIPSEAKLRSHLEEQLKLHPDWESIRVVLKVIGAVDSERVGVIEELTRELTVRRTDLESENESSEAEPTQLKQARSQSEVIPNQRQSL